MKNDENVAEIGILLYPDALLSAIYGLTDLFDVANTMAAQHAGLKRPMIRVSHWQKSKSSGAIECIFDTYPDLQHHSVFVVSPPVMTEPISKEEAAPFAKWLTDQHSHGATIAAVCGGSFLLGETGLLKGRSATTHWSYADLMARRFPDIKIEGDKLMIDDGDIITAGGFMAWTDLGLRMVQRVLGPTIMMETARFMLLDPPGREQRYYGTFSPKLHHGDAQILKVQHWLQSNGARDVKIAEMTQLVGMEERTFLRRFQKATEMKPTEYCQHLRVGKAREMLEFTNQNIEQIAWSVGYEDPGAFRKVFHKIVGLSPGDYRGRFSVPKAA